MEDVLNCVVTVCQHAKSPTESFSVVLLETRSQFIVKSGLELAIQSSCLSVQSAGIRV